MFCPWQKMSTFFYHFLVFTWQLFKKFCYSRFRTSACCDGCDTYYRGAAAITPATAAIVSLLLMLSLGKKPIGALRWDRRRRFIRNYLNYFKIGQDFDLQRNVTFSEKNPENCFEKVHVSFGIWHLANKPYHNSGTARVLLATRA